MRWIIVALVVVFVMLWLLRDKRPREMRRSAPQPKQNAIGSEAMMQCAYCHVHIPESEAVHDAAGLGFCSEQHRRLGANRS